MRNYKDISKVQDKMLYLSDEIRCLKYITKILNGMIVDCDIFSQEEIGYMSKIIHEKSIQIHKDYLKIENKLNI